MSLRPLGTGFFANGFRCNSGMTKTDNRRRRRLWWTRWWRTGRMNDGTSQVSTTGRPAAAAVAAAVRCVSGVRVTPCARVSRRRPFSYTGRPTDGNKIYKLRLQNWFADLLVDSFTVFIATKISRWETQLAEKTRKIISGTTTKPRPSGSKDGGGICSANRVEMYINGKKKIQQY